MKILHLSDTHGSGFWENPIQRDVEVVAHSGDLFPNRTRGFVEFETPYQREWLSRFAEPIQRWLDGRPLVYVPGNHDYYELADLMPAHRVSDNPIQVCGKTWAGFREIPYIRGEWAGEVRSSDMREVIEKLFHSASLLDKTSDCILLCHSPPAGMFDSPLDKSIHYGIPLLANVLQYYAHPFKAVLFGHVHQQSYQQTQTNGIIFSNAADTDGGIVELV